MRRVVILGTLLTVGLLSMGVSAWQQRGQGPNTVAVEQVRDNLYVLRGGGGNTAVFVTTAGVVLVDAKNPNWGQTILDAVAKITPRPVTTLINTHTHGDHVGGNVEFPASVDIVVQDNTRTNMQKMPAFTQSQSRGLPKRTFTDRMTIGSGADAVELYYFGPGHTNGDAWVVFPALRTAHTGDIFAGKALPLVDGANGGSVTRYPDTLRKAHAGIQNVDTIINGHSPTQTTWDDLRMFAEFNQEFLDWAQAQVKAGRAPAEAAGDWKLPARFEAAGYSPNVSTLFGGLAGRLTLLAEEMKGAR